MRKTLLFAVVVLASLGVAARTYSQEATSYSAAEIVNLYVELAFHSEGPRRNEALHKWPGDVRVNIHTVPSYSTFDADDRYRDIIDLVAAVATEISRPIGANHLRAPDADEMTNIVATGALLIPSALDNSVTVYVGTRAELQETNRKLSAIYPYAPRVHEGFLRGSEKTGAALCYAIVLPRSKADSSLWRGWLFLEDTPFLEDCIFEDLMQVFGILNDFPSGTPSMFNDDRVYNRPTELDWLLWRIHFDDRLKAGMTESEVRATIPPIIPELVKN